MRIFETHAHYDSKEFDTDREELLSRLHEGTLGIEGEVPVERIVNIGADMASSRSTVKLAENHDFIYAAIGVHPDSAGELAVSECDGTDGTKRIPYELCVKNTEELRHLAESERVRAIGEIGLDYHWNVWPKEVQKEAFRLQWDLAGELGLPVIIHSRDAAEDTLNMMKEFCNADKNRKAVMHCYSYSPEQAREYLKLGLMFGIGGVVTFKNAKKLKETVDMLPLESILLETDSPYMAPEPYRGKRNNSGFICFVAKTIADIKGIDVSRVYEQTRENAVGFFERKQKLMR